ncbi:MAG: Calx-beta domain-containing protein [Candidatus Thermoplasmatota archaeon]
MTIAALLTATVFVSPTAGAPLLPPESPANIDPAYEGDEACAEGSIRVTYGTGQVTCLPGTGTVADTCTEEQTPVLDNCLPAPPPVPCADFDFPACLTGEPAECNPMDPTTWGTTPVCMDPAGEVEGMLNEVLCAFNGATEGVLDMIISQIADCEEAPAALTVAVDDVSGAAEAPITVTAAVSGGTSPYECVWTSEGSATFTANEDPCTGATVSYAADGVYTVSLAVTDAADGSASDEGTVTVGTAPPPSCDPMNPETWGIPDAADPFCAGLLDDFPPGGLPAGAADGYYADFDQGLFGLAGLEDQSGAAYTLLRDSDGDVTLSGIIYDADGEYTPSAAGPMTAYLELDCGIFHDVVADICDAAGYSGTPSQIAASGTIGADGAFTATFASEDIDGLVGEAPLAIVNAFVTQPSWNGRHSSFNAASDAISLVDIATADLLADQSFTPLVLVGEGAAVPCADFDFPACLTGEPAECDPMDPTTWGTTPVCMDPAGEVEGMLNEVLCAFNGATEGVLDMIISQIADCEEAPAALTVAVDDVSGAAEAPITVTAAVSGGTSPYECVWTSEGSATFTANEDPCTGATVSYAADGVYTVSLAVTDAADGSASDEGTVTVSTAPPPSVISIVLDKASIDEGEMGTFTVSRPDAAAGAITVKVDVTRPAGTGDDFSLDPAAESGVITLSFGATELSKTVKLTASSDSVTAEADETVKLAIAAGDGYAADPAKKDATITIRDVPVPVAVVSIAADYPALDEGETATVTVAREAQSGFGMDKSQALVVSLTFSGAVKGTDFDTAVTDSVTIPANEDSVTFALTNKPEEVEDGSKTLVVAIASAASYEVSSSAGSVSIQLNDAGATLVGIRTAGAGATAAEAATPDVGVFEISRSTASTVLQVNLVRDGTAGCGTDYDLFIDEAAFACGETSVTFAIDETLILLTVEPNDDDTKEGSETVRVNLTAGSGYAVSGARSTATVAIQDDDVPTVTLTALDDLASEQDLEVAKFRLNRTGSVTDALTVAVTFSGTAQTADYTVSSLVIPAGKTHVNVTITPVQDNADESGETVIATIAPSSATPPLYQAGTGAVTVATIVDDDVDTDADTIVDALDNCPADANADQKDTDADKKGDACDADDDNDGLADSAETGTNPLNADSDGDGRQDGEEVAAGTDPLDPMSPSFMPSDVAAVATDAGMKVSWAAPSGIGVNRYLVFRFSEPTLVGTVSATAGKTAYEFVDEQYPGGNHSYAVQPMLPSQTGSAYNETAAIKTAEQSVPLCAVFTADADGDGLCDRQETVLGTNVTEADTDGDGDNDFAEVLAGSDPLKPNTVTPNEVTLARETPFWIGLILALATLIALVAGVAMARRRAPLPPEAVTQEPTQP